MEQNQKHQSTPSTLNDGDFLQPVNACYVEVNDFDMINVGSYTLATGQQLFDIGIIFAANISYDPSTQQAGLFFNERVQYMLDNAATQIQPLQAKGIKVLLSLLGNHQGAGICNFPTQQAAAAYAQILADAVTQYGLDGIDFDDEYADYGTNNTGQPNAYSFVYLVSALRQLLPDKIFTWYFIGPSTYLQSYDGVNIGSMINYSWNAYYGTFSAPDVPGLNNTNLGPAAISIDQTPVSLADSLANQTLQGQYGVVMYFNLPNTDSSSYLSNVSDILYGEATVYNGQ